MRGPDGWARRVGKFDNHDNCVKAEYFDEKGATLRMQVIVDKVYPIERLGLQAGDVFLSYDGKEIIDSCSFNSSRNSEDGQQSPRELRFRRGDKIMTVMVRPGKMGVDLRDTFVTDTEK